MQEAGGARPSRLMRVAVFHRRFDRGFQRAEARSMAVSEAGRRPLDGESDQRADPLC